MAASIFTSRLQIRLYTENDFPHIFRLQSDEEIMRYIRAATIDERIVRERSDKWLSYAAENPGYGVWILEDKDNNSFIGYAVLRHVEFTPGKEIEVGYTVEKEHWGKGYATEATLGLMHYAKEKLGISSFVAFTDTENAASNRVMEKCGFQRAGMVRVYDAECLKWTMDNEQ
ncbi:MAG: GNAT family N-acetyltransferase [Bacteroidetes bacterium]|nr:GNAT family N-acetyltransferase [Bacteroidota bacterium]